MRLLASALVLFAAATFAAPPAHAGTVEKTVPFAFDQWTALDSTDGPVTLHRVRIIRQKGGFTKSAFLRPGNDEYLETVQIQLEYSNTSKDDWKAKLEIAWLDDQGTLIDGYNDSDSLDDDESHTSDTVTLSTLKYGIARAKQLRFKIRFDRD
jgi:hypothetical protein